MATRVRGALVAGALLAAAVLRVPSANASIDPLRRATENIVQAPLDLAATPAILVYNTVKDFYASKKYTVAQKIYGTPPALLFASVINVTTSVGGAFARASAGIIEVPIGIVSLVANKNPAPLYGTTDMKALVDFPNDVFTVKFGLNQIAD